MKFLLYFFTGLALAPSVQARLNVVATLPDFAAIARDIGGDKVTVTSIAKGTEDPHFVDARPSFIRLLNQADVLLESGADLEAGWLPTLLNNARNRKIVANAPGNIRMAHGIQLLDVPEGPIDRSMGDVHPAGNPHFWLDPVNVKLMAAHLADRFGKLDPRNAAAYAENLVRWKSRWEQKLAEWNKTMQPYRGTKMVTYHKSFDYLAKTFGWQIIGHMEPKPGIEPSPTHLNALVPRAKAEGVQLVIVEPNRPRKTPEYVARETGAKLVIVPGLVGGHPKAADNVALFDYIVGQVSAALKH